MTRRELLTYCMAGCLAPAVVGVGRLAVAQQPQTPGRARLNTPAAQPGGQPQQPADATPRVQRPGTELQMPKELEDLLIIWEQKSAKVNRLRGQIFRYKYDTVYSVETRARGAFFYQAPDMGRIDFAPGDLKEASGMKDKNKQPFVVQADGKQKWVCTGKQVFVIDDDKQLYGKIDIPVQQQGKNIINGPLPFLFGMKAAQAKTRYHLNLGSMHYPQGARLKQKDGRELVFPPQVHVVAVPKLEVDAREWSRAEVLLDASTFIPTAIKLFNPQGTMETVYKFPPSDMKVNERLWLDNPFNERPPASYTLDFDSRAEAEDTEPAQTK